MSKAPTLTDVSSGFLSANTINNNNTAIETAFQNTLSRDGSTPNTMAADIDMDSNDLLNVGTLHVTTLVVDGVDISDAQTYATNALTSATAAATSATAAATSETNADASATEASHWAQYAEDTPVPEGDGSEFSAYHWSQKAKSVATGNTDITVSYAAGSFDVQSSTGANGTVNAATTLLAGAMSATDKTKLDGIETGATADQTGAEIKAAYEAEADTNAFTDSDQTIVQSDAVSSLGGLTLTDGALVYGSSGNLVQLAAGTAGKVLTMNAGGTAPTWSASGSCQFLLSVDAATDASIEFNSNYFDATTYDAYLFVFQNVKPTNDGDNFYVRLSNDGGSTYRSGVSDYQTKKWGSASANSAQFQLTDTTLGNGSGEDGISGQLIVFNPGLVKKTIMTSYCAHFNTSTTLNEDGRVGCVNFQEANDAIQFTFSTGTIDSGTITMYGLKSA